MAEVTLGLAGVAATVGAAAITAASGFSGRHESVHRQEIMDTERTTQAFRENTHHGGDIMMSEEQEFWTTRQNVIRSQDQYYQSIEDYKETSWFNLPKKLEKKREVRTWKREVRRRNNSLRSINESAASGSDTSSVSASSGSPPGSNLARDRISNWANDIRDSGTMEAEIPRIIGMFTEADPAVRESAVGVFAKLAEEPSHHVPMLPGIPALIELLDDDSVQASALDTFKVLLEYGNFHAALIPGVPHILRILKNEHSASQSPATEVFHVLARYPAFHVPLEAAIPEIVQLLGPESRHLQQRSIWIFQDLLKNHPTFHEALKPGVPFIVNIVQFNHGAGDVFFGVFNDLASTAFFIKAMSAELPNIFQMLRNRYDRVRDSAVRVIKTLSESGELYRAAAKFMGLISSSDSCRGMITSQFPELIDMLCDRNKDVRDATREVLEKLAGNSSFHAAIVVEIPRIVTMLKDQDDGVHASIVSVLEKLSMIDKGAFHGALGAAANVADPGLRLRVEQLLSKVGTSGNMVSLGSSYSSSSLGRFELGAWYGGSEWRLR